MSIESAAARAYLAAPVEIYHTGDASLALRCYGEGPALLLVHGFPLHGFTWRQLLPTLARHYRCYVPDLAGKGASAWSAATDFRFPAHAARLKCLVDQLGLQRYALMAQDTGATIARCLALIDERRVSRLVLFNTEIPHHRPPWIELYQRLMAWPGAASVFRLLLRSRAYRRSGMGLGGCFHDLRLLDGEFHQHMIQPLIESAARTDGVIRYLRGITWPVVDALAQDHGRIQAPVQLVWGEDDPTFPLEHARRMCGQFGNCQELVAIPDSKLLVYEEQPERVLEKVLPFLQAS